MYPNNLYAPAPATPWYRHWWYLLLALPLLIATWPYLLIWWLVWKKTRLPIVIKIVLSIMLFMIYLVLAAMIIGSQGMHRTRSIAVTKNSNNNQNLTITTGKKKHGSIFPTLQADIAPINNNMGYPTLEAACKQVIQDLSPVQTMPNIPDKHANSDWVSAEITISDAAHDCVNGFTDHNDNWIALSYAEFDKAKPLLAAATADVKVALNTSS